MEKISFEQSNGYAQQFDTFKQSKLFKRLKEKFRVKPYHEENRTLKIVVLFTSYLFNIFSITTGFIFLAFLLKSSLGLVIAVSLTIVMLLALEGLKRQILQPIFKNYFQFNRKSIIKIIVALGLVSLSAYISFHGGAVSAELTQHETKTDTTKAFYLAAIANKTETQNKLLGVKYKGTTTRTAQKGINAIQQEINALQGQLSKHLEEQRLKESKSNDMKKLYGLILSLLAVFFDLSLIFCLCYLEYYDYRSYSEFATIEDSSTATVSNDNTPIGGGANEVNSKELTNDSKTIATTAQKNCLNCNAVFDVTNPKKKFCNTTCRVKHWEAKNKKTLTVPTA